MELQSIKQRFEIIGNSPKLNYALQTAVKVAPTDISVLITGESGVGKEAFSKIIHTLSHRKHGPFIAVNCGAIPEGTIDSELFGHEKGAFTGAHDTRKGYFETVNGGTIFLDEVGELPLETQARLLRILESGEFIKVGSSKTQKTDVRVVAATNRDLLERTQQGKFREDLYYRLCTVPIAVPALRERPEDIYLLFRKFAETTAEQYRSEPINLTPEAREMLSRYRWPGNVRQLKNVVEQISILETERNITPERLAQYLPDERRNLPVHVGAEQDKNASFSEREIFYKVLFDLRQDVSDLKKIVFGLLENSGNMGESLHSNRESFSPLYPNTPAETENRPVTAPPQPVKPMEVYIEAIDETPHTEEFLSLEKKEKELIQKALQKYHGRRRKAAEELGISERTLYRKIKLYDLEQ